MRPQQQRRRHRQMRHFIEQQRLNPTGGLQHGRDRGFPTSTLNRTPTCLFHERLASPGMPRRPVPPPRRATKIYNAHHPA